VYTGRGSEEADQFDFYIGSGPSISSGSFVSQLLRAVTSQVPRVPKSKYVRYPPRKTIKMELKMSHASSLSTCSRTLDALEQETDHEGEVGAFSGWWSTMLPFAG
jgi:hypothetical protein